MLEYEDQVDNESLHSLDIEFKGLYTLMRTNGDKKDIDPANEKLLRSTREKNLHHMDDVKNAFFQGELE